MKGGRWILGLLLSSALFVSGCYRTMVSSGRPAAPGPSVVYDGKWHSGLVWGIAELSGPYDLDEICPDGWSEIHTRTSFLNGFVELVTSGIYAPQSVTIVCAAGPNGNAEPPNQEASDPGDEGEAGETD